MKDVACRLESFSPFDLQGTAEHLSAMAAKGWQLESIGPFLWKYRRAEPARIHYAVASPPAGGESGGEGERLYFQDLCAAAGWEKVTDWAAMQIYANKMERPTPLETDEALRLESVHRSMRSTYLAGRWNSLGCDAVLLLARILEFFLTPYNFFLSNVSLGVSLACLLLIAANLSAIAAYWLWYRRSRKSVEAEGGLAPVPRSYQTLSRLPDVLLVLGVLLPVLLEALAGDSLAAARCALVLALFLAAAALLYGLARFLRRRNVPRESRLAVEILCALLLALCLGSAFQSSLVRGTAPEVPSYTWQNFQWDREPQPLPLTVGDLTGENWAHIHRRIYDQSRSLLASRATYYETAAREDGKQVFLNYIVLDTGSNFVYHRVLNSLIEADSTYQYRSEDPAPWGAETVYRQYRGGEARDHWFLCWPGRIVRIFAEGLEFTPEQTAAIGARLAPETWKEDTP